MLDPFLSQRNLAAINSPGKVGRWTSFTTVNPMDLVNAMGNVNSSSLNYLVVDDHVFFYIYLDAAGATTGSGALQINLPVPPLVFPNNVRCVAMGGIRANGTDVMRPAYGIIGTNSSVLAVHSQTLTTILGTECAVPGITAINVDYFTTTSGTLYLQGKYPIDI